MSGNTTLGWSQVKVNTTRGKQYRHLDSETKKYQTISPKSSSFYWVTTIIKYTTYHNPHCTAHAYSDTQDFLAWNTDVGSIVYISLHADWTSTIIKDCASTDCIIYLSVYNRRPSGHLGRKNASRFRATSANGFPLTNNSRCPQLSLNRWVRVRFARASRITPTLQ